MIENIQDAEIISEVKTGEENTDLLSKLANAVTPKKEPGKLEPQPTKNFWDSSESDFEPIKKEEKPKAEASSSEKSAGSTDTKVTDKIKMGSASAATGLLEVVTRSLLTGALSLKQKNKLKKAFTPEQIQLLEEKLLDAVLDKLDAEEKQLKGRFERLMTRYEKKVEKIPFSEKERNELKDAFFTYFDFANTQLSPKWYVIAEIVDKVGNRVIDTLSD